MDRDELLWAKVSNLFSWADQERHSREEVYKVMSEMKDKKTPAGSWETIGRDKNESVKELTTILQKAGERSRRYADEATMAPLPSRVVGSRKNEKGKQK